MLIPRPTYQPLIPTYLPTYRGDPREEGKDLPKVEEPVSRKEKLWN